MKTKSLDMYIKAFFCIALLSSCAIPQDGLMNVERPLWMLTEEQKDFNKMVRGTYLVNTDFGDESIMEPMNKNAAGSSVTGVWPKEKWWENSEWGKVDLKYDIFTEDGLTFLRLRAKKKSSTSPIFAQIRSRDWRASEEQTICKVKLLFKGPTGARWDLRFCGQRREGVFPGAFGWVEIDETIVVPAGKRSLMLIFYPGNLKEGTYGIKHVQIEEITMTTVEETIKKLYAGEYPKNLMRVSRFPLGLSTGFNIRGGGFMEAGLYAYAEADSNTIGPSGFPTVRVGSTATNKSIFGTKYYRNGEWQWLPYVEMFSPPFPTPLGNEPHTFSVYVKGKGKVGAVVSWKWFRQGETKEVELDGSDEWKRIVLPFDPIMMANPPHHARFFVQVAKGDHIWFDGMKVEKGTNATPYTTQLDTEVTLNIAQHETKLQYPDEKPECNYAVSGNLKGAALHVRVTDLYGESEELPAIPVKGEDISYGAFNFNVFPEKRHNVYRVEAWVTRGIERISPFAELVVGRIPKARYHDAWAPDSPFGIHVDWKRAHLKIAKKLGYNWKRNWSVFTWRAFEKEEGVYDRRFGSDFITFAHEIKMDSLMILVTTPKWAIEQYPDTKEGSGSLPRKGLYENYAYNLVKIYNDMFPGYIKSVEVWNEPFYSDVTLRKGVNASSGKAETVDDPKAYYLELLKEAYSGVKRADSNVEVVGICGTIDHVYRDFIKDLAKLGALDYLDAISYHNYEMGKGIPNAHIMHGIEEMMEGVTKNGATVPIQMTEGNPIRNMTSEGLLKHSIIVEKGQEDYINTSDMLVRYIINSLAAGTKRFYLYAMGTQGFFEGGANAAHRFGNDAYMSLHPTGLAASVAFRHLEDVRFEGWVELKKNIYAYFFASTKGRENVAVIIPDKSQEIPDFPLSFDGDVTVVDVFGNDIPEGRVLGSELVYVRGTADIATLKRVLEK